MSSSESVPVALSQKSKTCLTSEAVVQRCSVKKVFLEISQNSQKNSCTRVSFSTKLQASNVIRKETLAQVFSCEFCEIFKNTFSYRTFPVAASVTLKNSACKHTLLNRQNQVSVASDKNSMSDLASSNNAAANGVDGRIGQKT